MVYGLNEEEASGLRVRLRALARDPGLEAGAGFAERAEAMDFLESGILARIDPDISDSSPHTGLAGLRNDAESLMSRWEGADAALFRSLRSELRAAPDAGAALRGMLDAYVPARSPPASPREAGYELADVFLNGLLNPDPVPAETLPIEPEMVAYQKTPARIALEMIERAGLVPGELFCDVGCGLGQIPILARLLTGARAVGIEREPAYAGYARACADALGLGGVEFLAVDAREAAYSEVSVLFLFTPFQGGILGEVLERIRSQSRPGLRVFAYGPCAIPIARQAWLRTRGPLPEKGFGLTEFMKA